jgi:hypothetical protein
MVVLVEKEVEKVVVIEVIQEMVENVILIMKEL